MAESLISVGVEAVLSNLISVISGEISLTRGFKAELKLLSNNSTLILGLMHDAERSQVKGKAVTQWLKTLKSAAYDADDLLDEFAFEMLRRKLETQMLSKSLNFFSVSNPIAFHFKMSHKVKDINMLLDQVIEQGNKLGLQQQLVHHAVESSGSFTSHGKIHQTQPFIDDSKVFGRDADKSKVVSMLLQSESEEALSIVAIVGLGGLGKTTLAQLVYKDESVTSNYSHMMWVCVSDDFSTISILKEMADSLKLNIGDTSNIQAMIQCLKQKLEGKKYLLVLDDVWDTNANNWDLLRSSLLGINASKESRILVTTRSDKVASTAETFQARHLEKLSEEDSWFIFQQRAFARGGAKETSYLVDIGKKLVKRCGGVPLALKTLGALMHSTEEHKWMSIEGSTLWDLSGEKIGIMPALRLSFDRLPFWLKQCFAYCSIFPKDFKFEKDNLIQLWIAQGFIQSPQDLTMEDVGDDYFKSLLWISFFQDVEMDICGNITHCKMHDLVHDLVQHVSRSECLAMNVSKVKIDDIDVRHLSLGEEEDIVQTIPKENAKRFRTLSLASYVRDDFFMKTKYLRVLMLNGSKIKALPARISKWKHLRFLDVSNTKMTTFPASVTKLYNLQTLRLMDCEDFVEFPEGLENLVSLRHLYFNYGRMPSKVGQLSCLQTLQHFEVCEDKGRRIEELGPLSKLRGELTLQNLQLVRDNDEASGAKLSGKINLYKLDLSWTGGRKSADNDEDVLEGLQPPPNLKSLVIQDFLGGKFPSWMTLDTMNNNGHSLLPESLVKIQLINCKKCEHIPTLGELPFLKFLVIRGMHNVRFIGTEFYNKKERGASSSNVGGTKLKKGRTLFPALESFCLIDMDNLVEWTEAADAASGGLSVVFPRLEDLGIKKCYKLMTIPSHFPSLTCVVIKGVESGVPIAQISSSKVTTLRRVKIENVPQLKSLSEELFQHNKNNLTNMNIKDCEKLSYIPPDGLQMVASSLCYLKIKQCPKLMSIPSIHGLTSLGILKIIDCDGITNLPIGLGTCTSLEQLRVENCPNLISVPEEDLRELKSVSVLSICECRNLKYLRLEGFLHCLTRLQILNIGGYSDELDSFPFITNVDYIQKHPLRFKTLGLFGWAKLKSLPDLVQHLPSLNNLLISGFDGVEALPEWFGDFSSLRDLSIWECYNLKYLTPAESMKRLFTKLQELDIRKCPLLRKRCKRESGTEWYKISHIPLIKIDQVVIQNLSASTSSV